MYFHKGESNEYGLPFDQNDLPTKKQRFGIVTLIIINLILVIVLYILYANIVTHKTIEHYSLATISSIYSLSTITSSNIGYALSLTSSGKSVLGGGTSVYKDIALLTPQCPKYVSADSILSSNYLLSYYDNKLKASVISLFELNNARETKALSSATFYSNVYDIATLDSESGLFVVINQDFEEFQNTGTIVAGNIDKDNKYVISRGVPIVYAGNYSIDPAITRLSDNSFAITYYDNDSTGLPILVSRYGVVNPSDLTITLSDEVTVVENKDYALHHTITGLTSTTYLIGFYDGSGSSDQTGPISAILATITDSVNGETVVHGQVTLGAAVVLDSKIAAFNIASDRVDNSSAIFTFADVTADFSLTTILVAIDSTGLPSFGSAVSFSSGRTLSLVQTYLIMDLDVAVISRPSKVGKSNPNSVKFSILYSDITNDGILTTASGMITRSAELVQITPDFLINNGNPNPSALYSWAAITSVGNDKNPDDIQVVIAHTLTLDPCPASGSLSITSIQMLPSPFGVAITANSGSNTESQVLFSGSYTIPGKNNLIPGAVYFTNTFGELLGGDIMYGSEYTTYSDKYYYEDSATGTLVDASNSRIGIATSSDTISLLLN